MSVESRDAKEIFLHAVGLSSSEHRVAYLDEVCADDAELRMRVDALIFAHERPESLLDHAAAEHKATNEVAPTIELPVPEQPGTQIGPYKLLQQVGEGGMGVVYMAEQTKPVKRRVAVKIIKPGMDSRQVIARFEAERQALALMDHPNIAKVLDAATADSGQPYFVMELVKGVPVTQYCDEQHLTPKERLALFIPICQAVQHAHQKGIIHRDLKPSNVLVALYDGQPVPKVIDFGVAKATSQQLTEKTMFTQLGQIVGTLEYMSPEQAQVNQLDVDTRSDIYSLGVLLYELLTGATPLDRKRLQSAAFDEMMRIIREVEPPRPSMRLSTIDTLPSVAANRRIEPKKLRTLVRGELDWIVMKALEKDRARRYETANGFAVDIQRYLDDEPVVACPPSAGYRFRKFARRNTVMLATTAVVAAALLLGLVGTTWQWRRAESALFAKAKQTELAKAEAQRALDAEGLAKREGDVAKQEGRRADAMRLAAESEKIRAEFPVLSALLAIEAMETTRRRDEMVLPGAVDSLMNATIGLQGPPLVHEQPVRAVAFSPDDRALLTAGDDGTARIWDLTSPGHRLSSQELRGHGTDMYQRIVSVAFTPDGSNVVTGSLDGTARLWDLTVEDASASSRTFRHADAVNAVAISPNGRWLATACDDMTARLWDLSAPDPSASSLVLAGHGDKVQSVAFSKDGQWLATAGDDKIVRLWDVLRDEPSDAPIVLQGHTGPVACLAFGPESRWLISGSGDKTARLWDLHAEDLGASSIELTGHRGPVHSVAISADGNWIATASAKAQLWPLGDDRPISPPHVLLGHETSITRLAFSPDSRWLATAGWDHTARLWDLEAQNITESAVVLRGHEAELKDLAFSSDSKQLATACWDKTVRLWDLTASNPASDRILRGAGGQVAFSPDGSWLASTSRADESIRLWSWSANGPSGAPIVLAGYRPTNQHLRQMIISPDSRWLAGVSTNRVLIWDLVADPIAESRRELIGHTDEVRFLAYSPDSQWLASTSPDQSTRLWNLTAADPSKMPVTVGKFGSVAISPDAQWLALGGIDGTLHFWDFQALTTGGADATIPPIHELTAAGGQMNAIEFSPNSRHLIAGTSLGHVVMVDLHSHDVAGAVSNLPGHGTAILDLGITPDGRKAVIGGWGDTARLWEIGSRTTPEPTELKGHGGWLTSVAIAADGRMLVTGAEDNTARIWGLERPDDRPLVLREHGGIVGSVAISPDGRWVVTGCADGMVRLWDPHLDSLLQRARHLTGRELTPDERRQYSLLDSVQK